MTIPAVLTDGGAQASEAARAAEMSRNLASIISRGMSGEDPAGSASETAPAAPQVSRANADAAVSAVTQAAAQGSTVVGQPAPADGSVPAQPAVQGATSTEGGAPAENAEAQPEGPTTEDLQGVEEALVDLGVDLGVTRADVPPEMQPVYDRLLAAGATMTEAMLSDRLAAEEGRNIINTFRTQVEQNTDKVLLAIALSKPEVFEQAAAINDRMKQDPSFRDLVVRELAVDAKQREVERRQSVMEAADRRVAANRVTAATARASQKYGVDRTLAEKVVATTIIANGGQLDPSEVDNIVADLRPKAPKVKSAPIISPAAAQAARTVPTQPIGTAAPGSADVGGGASPGLVDTTNERQGAGGVFNKIVRAASRRVAIGPNQ